METPSEMTISELEPYFAEYIRRVKPHAPRAKVLQPCASCGKLLGARERRAACKFCGARQPRKKAQ